MATGTPGALLTGLICSLLPGVDALVCFETVCTCAQHGVKSMQTVQSVVAHCSLSLKHTSCGCEPHHALTFLAKCNVVCKAQNVVW